MKCLGGVFLVNVTVNYENVTSFFIAIHPALLVKSKSMVVLDHLAAIQINKMRPPRSIVMSEMEKVCPWFDVLM